MPPSAEPQSAQEYIISEERKACRTVSSESTNVTDVQEHVRGRGHCSDRSLPSHSDALARGSGQTARSSIRRGRWRHDEASSTCTAYSLRYRAISAAPVSVDMLCEKQSPYVHHGDEVVPDDVDFAHHVSLADCSRSSMTSQRDGPGKEMTNIQDRLSGTLASKKCPG
jgi:hypothetical protein